MEKLRRSKRGKKIAGVCKGIANALQIDVAYVRCFWLIFLLVPPFSTFLGVLVYAALAVAIPEQDEVRD